MPPPEESIWWRGKRGFHVGFFPRECVQVAVITIFFQSVQTGTTFPAGDIYDDRISCR